MFRTTLAPEAVVADLDRGREAASGAGSVSGPGARLVVGRARPPSPLARVLGRLLPRTPSGDALFHWLRFVAKHRRLPRRAGGSLLDALFRLKLDGLGDDLRVRVTDKEEAKRFVAERVGARHAVPTLAVLRSAAELDAAALPADCVVKPAHLAGGEVVIRTGGAAIPRGVVEAWFARSHHDRTREANYRPLEPRVIVEPVVFGDTALDDYKLFCVRGRVRMIQVDMNRRGRHVRRFHDRDWRALPFSIRYPAGGVRARPATLEAMIALAERLAQGFPILRVDLYTDGSEILVGELTNCPDGGQGRFLPPEGEAVATRLLFGDDLAP